MKKGLKGVVKSVDLNLIETNDISDIRKYLMKGTDIANNFWVNYKSIYWIIIWHSKYI